MKRTVLIALVAVAFVAGTTSMALADAAKGAGIAAAGSAHNFADNRKDKTAAVEGFETGIGGWNAKRAEICRVCHTPHDHGNAFAENGPLWNHSSSSVTYIPYASQTLDATDVGQPSGNSKLCLSCHDGSMALDSFDKYASTSSSGVKLGDSYSAGFITPAFGKNENGGAITDGDGTNLTGTHPISFAYNATLVLKDADLADPTTTVFKNGANSNFISKYLGEGSTLECSTCHDVHDSAGSVVVGTHLLRAPTKGDTSNSNGNASALCLSCHLK